MSLAFVSYAEDWLEEARMSSLEEGRCGGRVRTSVVKNLKGSQLEIGPNRCVELSPVGDMERDMLAQYKESST